MSEAEPEGEQFLAELAFAIFLLGLEENLGPSDYQELLNFSPGTPELREWRAEMGELIGEHLRARPHPTSALQAPTKSPPQGWLARVLARLRLSPTV